MSKTLGQIAHDAGGFTRQWRHMGAAQRDDWERIAQAVIEAQQVAVPAGFVLVPIEPTLEMISAGQDLVVHDTAYEDYRGVYKAMLAAAQGAKPC